MTAFDASMQVLRYFIPNFFFAILFRAFGMGYKSKKRLFIGLSIYLLYFAVIPATMITYMGVDSYKRAASLLVLIANLCIFIFTSDSVAITLFLLFVSCQATLILSIIFNLIRRLLGLEYPALILMFAIACPIVFILMLRYLVRPMRFMADNIHTGLPVLITIPILTMTVANIIPAFPKHNFENNPILCSMTMLMIECVYSLSIYTFYINLRRQTELMRKQHKAELLKSEMNDFHDYYENAKQMRHDVRHNNAVLLEYLDDGRIDEARDYLQENQKILSAGKREEYCQNTAADAVLHIYRKEAEAHKISCYFNTIIPEKTSMSDPELATLLSNLLENAVNASIKEQEDKRNITVEASIHDDNLKIEVSNYTTKNNIFNDGMPEISDLSDGHGIGTRSAASIVTRHDGMIRFSQNNNIFIVQIILPI